MSHFCLLADPAGYRVSDVDLLTDAEARRYWVELFDKHFAAVLESARASYGRGYTRQFEAARRQFAAALAPLQQQKVRWDGPLGVMELCRLREQALRDHTLHDPFRQAKARENRAAMQAYGPAIRRLSVLPEGLRWDRIVRGAFAGNIFDLSCSATMNYANQTVNFEDVLARVKPRPWLLDDFDALQARLPAKGGDPSPWARAVIFVDNAGADFILGIMPLARQLAAHGTHIVLAANERPSLNDITADETVPIIEELAAADPELAAFVSAGLFEVVSTGNDVPLIDLSKVSDELNAAAAEADLVVLEGMGRTVESNLHTTFTVDAVQLCLLKDPSVAARIKGLVFDCVCTYRPKA